MLGVPAGMTRVPGAKPWIKGLANVRGQLLPIIDLRQFLGSGMTPITRNTRVMVVNHREIPAGLLVDEVLGFRRFAEGEFTGDAPPTVARCERYLAGAFRRAQRAVAGAQPALGAREPGVRGSSGMTTTRPAISSRPGGALSGLLGAAAALALIAAFAYYYLHQPPRRRQGPAGGRSSFSARRRSAYSPRCCSSPRWPWPRGCAAPSWISATPPPRSARRTTATSRRSCACSMSSRVSRTATSRCRRPSRRTSPGRSPTPSTTRSMPCAAW